MGPLFFAIVLPFVVMLLTPLMRWLDERDAAREATMNSSLPVQMNTML